jgi:integration host factor subunit beta
VTKKDISRLVYNNTELNLVESQEAVQSTFEAISALLLQYGRVEIRGFGVFNVQRRAPRKAHNPRTGEIVMVEARDTVVFKPSKAIKEKLQQRLKEQQDADAADNSAES